MMKEWVIILSLFVYFRKRLLHKETYFYSSLRQKKMF
jgi:hypothetical protein